MKPETKTEVKPATGDTSDIAQLLVFAGLLTGLVLTLIMRKTLNRNEY